MQPSNSIHKAKKYYLVKTDPETFSITDFENEKITKWDGVHNYQAINCIKSWKIGDSILIYHSQGEATIVGLAQVISEPIKDVNDVRNISWCADLELLRVYPEEKRISLKDIKSSGLFGDFLLVKNPRLSVMECPNNFIEWLGTKISL